MLERPGLKASLTRRGVNIKMLTQDSIKAIFQGFQGKGCRNRTVGTAMRRAAGFQTSVRTAASAEQNAEVRQLRPAAAVGHSAAPYLPRTPNG